MKTDIIKILILISVLSFGCFFISGCNLGFSRIPDMILPDEGEIFTDEAPTFIWSFEPKATGYILQIRGDSDLDYRTLLDVVVEDTTFTLPEALFQGVPSGTYLWKIASISDSRYNIETEEQTFKIDRILPLLDLDTTYFPFGLDYRWIFERYFYEDVQTMEGGGTWEEYDTVAVQVIDSFWVSTGFVIYLSGDMLRDIGSYEHTFGNLFSLYGVLKVPPIPDLTDYTFDGFKTYYNSDTFISQYSESGPAIYYGTSSTDYTWSTYRIKNIGVVKQIYSRSSCGKYDYYYYSETDHLLYFIKGEDTAWRCPECP